MSREEEFKALEETMINCLYERYNIEDNTLQLFRYTVYNDLSDGEELLFRGQYFTLIYDFEQDLVVVGVNDAEINDLYAIRTKILKGIFDNND